MMKYIYSILFIMTLTAVVPQGVMANVEIIEQEQQPVVSVTNESTIHVVNANGQMLYVYNVAGVRVKSIVVDGHDRHYDLNLPKGCYIIKVGKTVRKISIR
ncbi:MAG: T9SS type A sorting domain-containing protein [Prevotella sp.]|nr:T9SS type A sorting domain-containing protein [Prevotella sp.]MDE6150809.1 T9SS type A sorting domain-containing protein [Prevotella sp.]